MSAEKKQKVDQKGPEGRRVDVFTSDDCKGGPKLFNNRVCPFGNRAWWAAVEKNVKFEYIHVDLREAQPPSYAIVNPYETVPCFYDQGRGVFESTNIAEFFEECYPGQGTQLMPSDVYLRAAVREVISKFEVGYFYDHVRNQDLTKKEELEKKTHAELEWFAGLYSKASDSGPFFLGEQLSMVEIAVMPFLERFSIALQHYRGFDLLPTSNTKLTRLRLALEAVRTRPAWLVCSQSPDFFIQSYASYGGKTDSELQAEK